MLCLVVGKVAFEVGDVGEDTSVKAFVELVFVGDSGEKILGDNNVAVGDGDG